MIVALRAARAQTCGSKAGSLGTLLRAGLPVPEGFVVTLAAYRALASDMSPGTIDTPGDSDALRLAALNHPLPRGLLEAISRELASLGDPPVAVRSSAADEDTAMASAAGQYESALAVHGLDAVIHAVRACWASLHSRRSIEYRRSIDDRSASRHLRPSGNPAMAVLVQRHVDADVSGVMFTPGRPDGVTEIEASLGLGPSVVGGTVMPDSYRVGPDGSVACAVAEKASRLDRQGARLVTRNIAAATRRQPSLDDETAVRLARTGRRAAAVLGGAQDIEWAIADGKIWLLQARPVTAVPPPSSPSTATGVSSTRPEALAGTPGSHGIATGIARIVRGPADFSRVRPGDILVCPYTDPAWTPLLAVAAGVVTETGGVLAHAAIVARERRIPAVLGVAHATTRLHDGATITIDGTTGTVTLAPD